MQDLQREPTIEEIAKALGVTPEKVRERQATDIRIVSLSAPIHSGRSAQSEEISVGDLVADPNASLDLDYMAHTWANQEETEKYLALLDVRERELVDARFGLTGGKPQTLEQIGMLLGVTRERARQLESGVLEKLRRYEAVTYLAQAVGLNEAETYVLEQHLLVRKLERGAADATYRNLVTTFKKSDR